jgi:outer membrane murein-binding lipoprotein Lpp
VTGKPTAARVRELAAQAKTLAGAIDALKADFRACGDEPVRRTGFRCDATAGWARQAAAGLEETADDLDRVAAASVPGTCEIPWGVCPEHGATLRSSGGRTWCGATMCHREWAYNRMDLPCTGPARWRVTDQQGAARLVCDGHALDARARLVGAILRPLRSTGSNQ